MMPFAIRPFLASACLATTLMSGCAAKTDSATPMPPRAQAAPGTRTQAIAQEAYIYAFPMIAAYKAMYELNIDTTSSQYKGPFNRIVNEARVFTYQDTSIVTPNSDTPYSMLQMDLRAEPLVLCVPAVDPKRYYAVQLTDLNTFNYGYIGSRATGSGAGCYLVAGPRWTGTAPAGVAKTFRSSTDFSLAIYRTQLFNPADMPNVQKVQAGYSVATLSQFTKTPAPPAAPAIDFLPFTDEAFKTEFPAFLDFLLQFSPPVPEEAALRARFASIGIGPDKTFAFADLPLAQKLEVGLGAKEGYAAIDRRRDRIGRRINGWSVGSAFGDRQFFNGDYLLRAAAALAGVYGNDAVEATYPLARADQYGRTLDGSKRNYTLTFAAGQLPPVNAFWSVTMYDGRTQLLIQNPINRYLINSPMLPGLKKNPDGSLTLYIQKDSPGAAKAANWLPAPDGPIYLVMRLYWPKTTPPSILPPGDGTWKPPGLVQVKS